MFYDLGERFLKVKNADEILETGQFQKYGYVFKNNYYKNMFILAEKYDFFFVAVHSDENISNPLVYMFYSDDNTLFRVTYYYPHCSKCKKVHLGVHPETTGHCFLTGDLRNEYFARIRNHKPIKCIYCGGTFEFTMPLWVTHLPEH